MRIGADGGTPTPNVSHQMYKRKRQGWGLFPGTFLPCRNDSQVARIVAVNGTHRPPDALAPLINVRRGAEGADKLTPNVTKQIQLNRKHTEW